MFMLMVLVLALLLALLCTLESHAFPTITIIEPPHPPVSLRSLLCRDTALLHQAHTPPRPPQLYALTV